MVIIANPGPPLIGVSLEHQLLYGYDLGSREDWALETAPDWVEGDFQKEVLARLTKALVQSDSAVMDEQSMRDLVRDRTALDLMPVGILHESPRHVLACGRQHVARGGRSVAITELVLTDPEADELLTWALKIADLRPTQKEPSWLLTGSYG